MPWVAIIGTIASAALANHQQNQAAKQQKQQMVQAQQRQLNAQNAATDVAMKKVEEFDPNTRKASQDAIAQELQGGYEKEIGAPQITAQGVEVGSSAPGGTTDFLTAKAREKSKATESLRQLAALMGRTGSASQLRRNEAVGFGDAVGEIGRIQTGANNIWGADQVGIGASGQPNLGATLASAALGAYSQGKLAAGAGKPAPVLGTPSGPTGGWV